MLASTFLHALSASLVKRLNVNIPPVDTVMGGLMISLPIILLFWWLNGSLWPESITISGQISIIYLGIIGSLADFLLCYQVLSRFSATLSSGSL
jgi:drug/metabolite transporter (DMT)-like permease